MTTPPLWRSANIQRNDDFACRHIEDEALLIPIRTNMATDNRLFSLNATGRRVWELADGSRTGAEILNELEAEFDVPFPTLEADLDRFLGTLVEVGGIQLKDPR